MVDNVRVYFGVSVIYNHIPFRKSRRVFDTAYTVPPKDVANSLVSAMFEEIAYYGDRYGNREPLNAIQFGGGDSSLMSAHNLHELLRYYHDHFEVHDRTEISLEIDPSDDILDNISTLKSIGINRLSISAISFFQEDIDLLGGSHEAGTTESVLEKARSAGIENVSLDLFFGLPHRDMEYWGANLERACRLGVPHLSIYGLTGDEVEILEEQELPEPFHMVFEKEEDDQYLFTMDYLEKKGYVQYDICNFALEGFVSENARAYSELENYIGIGPSAHSLWKAGLPDPSIYRWSNVPSVEQYEKLLYSHNLPLEQKYPVDMDEWTSEYIMLRLRTNEGLDLDELENEHGVDLLSDHIEFIADLEREHFIEPIRNSIVKLTKDGRLRSDKIVQRLLTKGESE